MIPLLKVNNLTTNLEVDNHVYKVVNDLSFELHAGRTLALVGESGCGKSMTALSLMRIVSTPPILPPVGEVLYNGVNLLTLSQAEMRKIRGEKIAMIFQDPRSALNPVLTIGDQLLEVCLIHLGCEVQQAKQHIFEALEEVHLSNPGQIFQAYPHQLSGGMLQRVMIAMALLCEPDILIADEPTTALDVTIQKQILQLLKELQKKRGMATLLITHDMGVVAEMADEVIVMYAGQKIEQAMINDLFDAPSHPYTQALFAARPDRSLKEGKLPTIQGNVPRLNQLPKGCHFHPRCTYCMEMCQSGGVPTFELPNKTHKARCWLFDENLEWKLEDEAHTF